MGGPFDFGIPQLGMPAPIKLAGDLPKESMPLGAILIVAKDVLPPITP